MQEARQVHRLVQFSDVHFGQERDGTKPVHEDVRAALVADVTQLAQTRGAVSLVLGIGDIAYSGRESEYKEADAWLERLVAAASCEQRDVRTVPGNHDCDRTKLTRLALTLHKTIRAGTSKSAEADLEDVSKGAEEANPLLPKLRAYRTFAAGYDSDFSSIANPSWTKDLPLGEGIVLRLVGMNTVQVCDSTDHAGAMILGSAQYILPPAQHAIHVAIMHHPLDWLLDKLEAKQYLHSRTKILMHGHEHVSAIQKTVDLLRHERLEVYSGATNPPEDGRAYRYSYNWIEVSLRRAGKSHTLDVTVFPRVWVSEQTRFAPDLERLAGKESALVEIDCPGLVPPAGTLADTSPTVMPDGPGPHTTTHTVARSMSTDDDVGFSKLKFLFWRHLDWQQRLTVLVQANALPVTVDRPMPHTMEKLALEHARKHGKLAAVWDATMEYVPADKRQDNPFAKGRT